MAYGMRLFHYRPGDSCLHRAHPGVKLILVVGYSILIFLLQLPLLFILLLAELSVMYIARTGIGQMIKELKGFFIFLLIIFVFRAYSGGETGFVFSVLPVPPIRGIMDAAYITIRLCMVIFLGSLFTSTTKTSRLQNVLFSLFSRVPHFPAARVSILMSLTIRSIPLLFDKVQEVNDARKARCIQSNKNPFYKIFSFALPLLLHVIKRADDMSCSMEARCYTEDRTPAPDPLKKVDYIMVFTALLSGICFLLLHYFLPFIF
jgi:energy-coupling factor transporter transmembrane protein EcfT